MLTDTLLSQPVQTIVQRPVDTVVPISVQEAIPTIKPVFDFAETVEIGTFERSSIFDGHLLTPVHTNELPVPDLFNAWFFALLFFGFVLYAWLISFNIKRMGHLRAHKAAGQALPRAKYSFFGGRRPDGRHPSDRHAGRGY